MIKKVTTPLTADQVRFLRSGDEVRITGTIYTARDAAHKRLCELLDKGEPLPFDVKNSIIYYVGPTPAREGQAIGSAGPTTSYRMDAYSPAMIAAGERGMIGKGKRSPEVIEAMKKYGAVYFGAIGGAGAYLSKCIRKAEVVAYDDLGSEAVRRLEVEDFPAFVIIDSEGRNLYETGRADYLNPSNKTIIEGTAKKKLVLGVIGADVHAVGNTILNRAFLDAGFDVTNLGVLVPQEEFIDAAVETGADAIIVSSLYGQGEIDCTGMREKCDEAGLKGILLYAGGNLVVGKVPAQEIERRYKELGFDRAFPPGTDPAVDIAFLRQDLHMDEEV